MENLIIRRICRDDAKQLRTLRLKGLVTDADMFLALLEEDQDKPISETEKLIERDYIFGAFLENRLVGILSLMEQERTKFKHIGILGGMYVDPKYRKKGIGRKLVEKMLEYVKALPQFYSLQLKVITTNIAAIKLYESFGFVCWATEENAFHYKGKYWDQHHYMFIVHPVGQKSSGLKQ